MRLGELGVLVPLDSIDGEDVRRYLLRSPQGPILQEVPDYALMMFLGIQGEPSEDGVDLMRVLYQDVVGWTWGYLVPLKEDDETG